MCGVSDDRGTGFSFVRWLFGGCMVGLLVVTSVPLLLSLLLSIVALLLSLCYTEKAPNAWQRRGTQKTRNTYNQPNRPNQQTSQTKLSLCNTVEERIGMHSHGPMKPASHLCSHTRTVAVRVVKW